MSIIRFLLSLFKRQPYEDCCPHDLRTRTYLAALKKDPREPYWGSDK